MSEPYNNQGGSHVLSTEEVLELVTRAKSGDQKAFATLYETFVSPIYRFIFFTIRNKHIAEDLTQTVFLRAFRALPGYTERGVPFPAWLYTIARNAMIDHWKKKRDVLVENPEEVFGEIESQEMGAEEESGQKRRATYVQELLRELSDEQREVVTLFFVEELSHAEIARITGKTEEAVRALKHRALKALRGKVDERYL